MAVSQTKAPRVAVVTEEGEMTKFPARRPGPGPGPVEPAKLSALSRAGLRSDADPRRA
ncbi:MAG TPA: hypothetical protein VF933_08520 [Streptosporangiaceae bacterium]